MSHIVQIETEVRDAVAVAAACVVAIKVDSRLAAPADRRLSFLSIGDLR